MELHLHLSPHPRNSMKHHFTTDLKSPVFLYRNSNRKQDPSAFLLEIIVSKAYPIQLHDRRICSNDVMKTIIQKIKTNLQYIHYN
jgi:hypothetical protein